MYAEEQAGTDAHDHEAVLAVVDRLTKQDLARLRAAAYIWIRDLRLATLAADPDLVSEASFRPTSGQRTRKIGISLMEHLRGVMRSNRVGWNLKARASKRAEVTELGGTSKRRQ